MRRVVTFGEAMLRLTTPLGEPLAATPGFSAPVGGAELNVAIAARRQGAESTWVSTLPVGPLGDRVARHAAAHGVETVLRRIEGRIGLYFLEQALPPRASRIIYDRKDTAFVRRPEPESDWQDLIDAHSCLVVSGITAALGAEPRRALDAAIDAAVAEGAIVAVDLNYRGSLWSIENALTWLKGIIDRVDILSASPKELAGLGMSGDETDLYRKAVDQLQLQAAVGTVKTVRGRTADVTMYAATPDGFASTAVTAEILDPVGGGDAMFGTFVAGLGELPLEEALIRAAGALVTAYGLAGDALSADPWSPDEKGGVRR